MAINFVKNEDVKILRDIEQYYSTQIDEMPMNGKNYLGKRSQVSSYGFDLILIKISIFFIAYACSEY